jgi:hypothetical protein
VGGDWSCEEMRWEAYAEIKATGSCAQAAQRLNALAAEKQAQRQQVLALLKHKQVRSMASAPYSL